MESFTPNKTVLVSKIGSDFDMTRITKRIIAMSLLSSHKTDKKLRRNNILDVANYLNSTCQNKYLIVNLIGILRIHSR